MSNILVVIPARGGSKGIPRKNIRPLHGKPLIYYSVSTALKSKYKPDVYVSTDDVEIAFFAKKYGANVHHRAENLASDEITLDPVIYTACQDIQNQKDKQYDYIVTLQPTSPLLKTDSLDEAIEKIVKDDEINTVISCINDSHLSWRKEGGRCIPNYEKRVNRQELPQIFKETGSFFISHHSVVSEKSRIGNKVELYELPGNEAIDIDTFEDWALCEFYLNRKRIVFNVAGCQKIGLGHVYNCLLLANEIVDHELVFLVDRDSDLAFSKLRLYNYPVFQQADENLVDTIRSLNPDVVINDRLDTSKEFISELKEEGYKVINFEDLGEGASHADLVINAIYPEREVLPKHYFGARYFCAREEFLLENDKVSNSEVSEVLISFGGVDPNNLTLKVLRSIHSYCFKNALKITVILGLGYQQKQLLADFSGVEIHSNINNISDYMRKADVAFSSAGRTVYELALCKTPSIILAQNTRELSHFFASSENGFVNLGLGNEVDNEGILRTFKRIVTNTEARLEMSKKMAENDIRNGKNRVIKLIKDLINN